MLRHWDEIGLLRPASVDPSSGYRGYAPAQVAELAEIVRLRDLGVGLVEIDHVIHGDPATARGVLERARERLRRTVVEETARLVRFDAHLRSSEGVRIMSIEIDHRFVAAQRVATLTRTATAFGHDAIGPVVGPMFPQVEALLRAAGVASGPAVAVYTADETGDGPGVLVTAGFVVGDEVAAVPGLDVHTLAAVPEAAVMTHRGSVDGIADAWTALIDAVRAEAAEPSDAGREISLTPGDRPQSEWVTELVQPIRR